MSRAKDRWGMKQATPEVPGDDDPVKITVVVPFKIRRAARVAAIKQEITLQEFVLRALANEVFES